MLRVAFAVSVLMAFHAISILNEVPSHTVVAAKCTGQDPCPACSNCTQCGYCKQGRTCGACKPRKRLLAVNVCQ